MSVAPNLYGSASWDEAFPSDVLIGYGEPGHDFASWSGAVADDDPSDCPDEGDATARVTDDTL